MATKKSLPPLPRSVYFPTGRVSVKRRKGLMEAEQAYGLFNWIKRSIEIDAELGLNAAWLTMFHETMHVILMDSGIALDHETTERLCDTYASFRVSEMLR